MIAQRRYGREATSSEYLYAEGVSVSKEIFDKVSRYKGMDMLKFADGSGYVIPCTYKKMWLPRERLTSAVERVSPSQEDNWELLSVLHYGDPTLWWVLLDYNGISNPFDREFMTVGKVFRVPVKQALKYVYKYLG